MKQLKWIFLIFVSVLWLAPQQAFANKNKEPLPLPEIAGRVTDEKRRPVVGAQVNVCNEKGAVIGSEETNKDGTFAIHHEPCVVCNLEVIPDDKGELASAFVDSIPGGVTRRFVFTLQKGFSINGRITSHGKGVKAASVKVVSTDDEAPSKVHSGGVATTARDGSFALRLTPGKKHMKVTNAKNAGAEPKFEKDFEVLCDTTLDDISL